MTDSSEPGQPAAFSYPGHGPNARIGVAICHGFTGSPLSVLPWARQLAEQGFAVRVPLLPGHGTSWLDLARTTWRQWQGTFAEATEELARSVDQVFVAGLSMGGAIALHTASQHSVAGVCLVNPGLSFYDKRIWVIGVLKFFQRSVVPKVEECSTAPATADGDYSRTPLAAVHELKKLFSASIRALPAVTAPVLVFRSVTDDVVPPSSLAIIRHGLAERPRVVDLPNSGHVATLDTDANVIFAGTVDFIHLHSSSESARETP